MRKFLTLLIVMLSFLWTGCSAVHQKTSPILSETSPSVSKTSRISEEASKTYVARFADVFCDKTPVTEQLINDAILRSLEVKINAMSRIDDEEDWYVFSNAGVQWKNDDTLQIEVKKSLRENGQEVQWLVRSYIAEVQRIHDMEKNEFEVRITPDSIVSERTSPEYYQYMPDDMYVPSKCNLSNVSPAPWGNHDFAIVSAFKSTLQDFMDENENAIYYTQPGTYSFSKTVSGNPQAIRRAFTAYLADKKENAVVTRKGVFYAGSQLVHIIDSSNSVTFMWDVKLQQEVGLEEVTHRNFFYEWSILAATKKYVSAL
ncbi:MAG: hypothetical protein ACERJ1_09315 [Halodesulfovibrio sp.]|uniref:hypothetical protein n=1 Tax=Halodesulfovibrio sp. TaxID=1912772 RepID=UPI00359D3651